MPVIKSAIKKLRQDKKREKQNNKLRDSVKTVIRLAKKSKSGKNISKAIATVDKAAKNNIIHKNKAARLKSTLSKIAKPISHKVTNKGVKTPAKQTPVKTKTVTSKTNTVRRHKMASTLGVKKSVSKKSSK